MSGAEGAVPAAVRGHVLAALRELLANVARHADATAAQVTVRVDDHGVLLRVVDNGRGLGQTTRRSGLANLRERAESLGGRMELGPGVLERGTCVEWQAPLTG